MYEFSKLIPSSWDSETTLHKLFPYDKNESVTIKPYPMVKDSLECDLHVIIRNDDAQGFVLDLGLAESYLEEYLYDLGADFEIMNRLEEEANMCKFVVSVSDFENYVLEKVSIAKDALSKLSSSLDSFEAMEYISIYDECPGWTNGKIYMTMTEKVPVDMIVGSSNVKIKKWGPTDWSAFKESIKSLCLGKPVCDQNPIRLIRIGDEYFVGGDGYNRVCAAKYLELSYVAAIVDSYDYDIGGDFDYDQFDSDDGYDDLSDIYDFTT